MRVAWCIDWLSCTFKHGLTDLDVRRATSFGFPLKTWTQSVPRFGYSICFTHPFGHTVMANINRPEMGVHLSLGGRALRSLSEGGIEATSLLDWCTSEGAKITRIDLAIDALDIPIDVIALADCPRIKSAPGSARNWKAIHGDDGGATVYIGSRSSEKFLRIYDKAAEQGLKDTHWTRFELELKRDCARAAAQHMSTITDAERGVYIKGLIRALFNPDDETFRKVIDVEAVRLVTAKDTEDNTVDWLLNVVSKALAKAVHRRGDIALWDLFAESVRLNLEELNKQSRIGDE